METSDKQAETSEKEAPTSEKEAETSEKEPPSGPVSPGEARELITGQTPTRVIDLRDAEARDEGYVPGSTTASEDELEELIGNSDEVEVFVLVCEDGSHSGELADRLRGEGHQVTSIEGGMEAWESKNEPMQPGEDFRFTGPGGAPGI